MAESAEDGTQLLASWKRIGSADRRAILDALPPERRNQFESVLAEVQLEHSADRQFLVYSGWLRPIIETAMVANRASGAAQKPAVLESLRRVHERIAPEIAAADLARTVLGQARRAIFRWVARL
jgi:hypothetical protein